MLARSLHAPACITTRAAEAAESLSEYDVAHRILHITFERRRSAEPDGPCAETPCPQCFSRHIDRVVAFVRCGRPVHFVLPAFPAKSRSRRKVLGRLPDMAESLALESIQAFCDRIAAVHSPGAVVTICSDGHVFSDSLEIPDEYVDDYGAELRRMIAAIGGGSIGVFTLLDALPPGSCEQRRGWLLERYADSVEDIRASVRTDESVRRMFNGIHRFVLEDNAALTPHLSTTQLRLRSKRVAYQVVQRSQAWSRLVAQTFPDSIRLSIHPQPPHGDKIGFHLLRTADDWLTPWHGVALDDGIHTTLVKRSYAQELGAHLVWRHSRPSHFVLPPLGES